MAPVLDVRGLHKTFQLHDRDAEMAAIIDLSFSVPAGGIVALQGPSGAGKSSVMKCLYRTYLPTAGEAILRCDDFEADLASADDHTVLRARAQYMGFVTQFLTVCRGNPLDVVANPLILQGVDRLGAHGRASELLAHLLVSPSTFGI